MIAYCKNINCDYDTGDMTSEDRVALKVNVDGGDFNKKICPNCGKKKLDVFEIGE